MARGVGTPCHLLSSKVAVEPRSQPARINVAGRDQVVKRDLARALGFVIRSPNPTIKIEPQGGDNFRAATKSVARQEQPVSIAVSDDPMTYSYRVLSQTQAYEQIPK